MLVWILLALNLVFPFDILKFGSGASFSAALGFGILATIINERPHWLRTREWIALPVGLLSLLAMGWYQASRQASMAAATRFVAPLSPLVVIPAILLIQWLTRFVDGQTDSKAGQWLQNATRLTILTAGLIGTGGAYTNLWVRTTGFFRHHFSFTGPLWVVLSAAVFTAFAFMVTTMIVWLVPKLKIWQQFITLVPFTQSGPQANSNAMAHHSSAPLSRILATSSSPYCFLPSSVGIKPAHESVLPYGRIDDS